jgi:hypothetical protein
MRQASVATSETMVVELEAPPEVPVRRRATPRHPISSMQEAFAESLDEATNGSVVQKPKLRRGDARFRREALLDQDKEGGPPDEIWRFRPGQRCHELRRLVAQISFGVYLLLEGMANNKVDVITILQGHIDEVDEFLETTMEDMALATTDLQERLKHLRLPMDNMEAFEKMLEDRNFRLQIVTRNEMIEHIVSRTTVALLQAEQDVTEGLKSTQEFTIYLAEQQHARWRHERPDVESIYEAMKGNTDGWFNAFMELQAKGSALNALIVKLNEVVNEMERRAGQVSRRTRFSIQPFTSPTQSIRSSQSSTSTTVTPADSPPRRIPDAPPRLSLRLSSIIQPRSSVSSYFDLSAKPDRSFSMASKEIHVEHAVAEEEQQEKRVEQAPEAGIMAGLEAKPAVETSAGRAVVPHEELGDKPLDEPVEELLFLLQPTVYQSPQFPPPRSPATESERRLSPEVETPRAPIVIPELQHLARNNQPETRANASEEDQLEEEAPLFILQPRTYTPQARPPKPQSPLPSPRVKEYPPRQPSRDSPVPPVLQTQEAKAEPQAEGQVKQRISLRQRVSLKTTPPHSIQVPPPRPRERQGPNHAASPRIYQGRDSAYRSGDSTDQTQTQESSYESRDTAYNGRDSGYQGRDSAYQGPDSAYASDIERPPIPSYVSMDPASVALPPTPEFQRPQLIPSPYSDQQFFRPVQASPHSPLQQRPHTSHTVTPRHPTYQQQHQRNAPSRMGMSMMSNVTTATNETGQTLKKKRSAFGWLKKAFSLDDEERAAFEQRRRDQAPPNPYHEPRAPKFLDGKRIR